MDDTLLSTTSTSTNTTTALAPTHPPLWVRVALFGVPDRKTARVFSLLALGVGALAVASAIAGHAVYGTASLFLLGFPVYDRAIRWTDRNGRWP